MRRRFSILQVLVPYTLVYWVVFALESSGAFGPMGVGLLSLMTIGLAVVAAGLVGTSQPLLWGGARSCYRCSRGRWSCADCSE